MTQIVDEVYINNFSPLEEGVILRKDLSSERLAYRGREFFLIMGNKSTPYPLLCQGGEKSCVIPGLIRNLFIIKRC